jgi:hypothetical protein
MNFGTKTFAPYVSGDFGVTDKWFYSKSIKTCRLSFLNIYIERGA